MVKKKVIIIIIGVFILICGTGITYSLFTSNSNLIANQKIAQFIFEATRTDSIALPITGLNPGDEPINYTFEVANNLEKKKSEVTINYQIILKTYQSCGIIIGFSLLPFRKRCKAVTEMPTG